MKGYPRWTTKLVFTTLFASVASGLLLLPTALALRQEWEVPWHLSGSDRVWVAALHCLLGWGMLWLVGAVWSIHMRAGWRRRQHWRSGLLLVALCLLLVLSALALFYVGDDDLLSWSSVMHWSSGTALGFAVLLHYVRAHSRRFAHSSA